MTGMNVSLYQAAAAMNANSRWQEVIAENLAAASVPGARAQQVSFSSVEAGVVPGLTGTSSSRFLMPTSKATTSFQQGTLRPTGVSTDVGIEGSGFLQVQLPNGTQAYTRDGDLHLNAQGQLVTKQGYAVTGDNGTIQLDPSSGGAISISATGEVTQGGENKGKVQLMEFTQPNELKSIGDGYFLAGTQQPTPSQTSRLRQGFLESGNTSATTEMASLMSAMRMFEANQKVMTMQDDRMGRVISDLGSPS